MIRKQPIKLTIMFLVGIFILIIFLYQPMLKSYFVSDDYYLWRLERNLNLWESFRLFLPKLFGGYKLTQYTVHFAPVAAWVMWLIAVPFRMNPVLAHLVSLALHLINAYLVSVLCILFTRKHRLGLISMLVFGTFPFITETVNFISANLYLLMTLFYLLSLISIIKYNFSPRQFWLMIHFVSFGLSLLSAEPAITIPITVVLSIWVVNKHPIHQMFFKLKPVLIGHLFIILVYSVLRFMSLGTLNIFVSSGHFELGSFSKMFIIYFIISLLLLILRFSFGRWITQEVKSKEKVFWLVLLILGISWLPTAKLVTQQRHLYLPAVFSAILVAFIFFVLNKKLNTFTKSLLYLVFSIWLMVQSLMTYRSSLTWLNAGNTAYSIVVQVSEILENNDSYESLYLVNIPDSLDGAYVHRSFFAEALEFYSGKLPPPLILTPLTLGTDTKIQITGPKSMRLISKDGFLLFKPNQDANKRYFIEWPNAYLALQVEPHILEVELIDSQFNWQSNKVYGYEKGMMKKIEAVN